MFSGLKIKFKNANELEEPKSSSKEDTPKDTSKEDILTSKKWQNSSENKSKLKKRKYDFGQSNQPIETNNPIIEKTPHTNEDSKEKRQIETVEELHSEVDNIWNLIKSGDLNNAGNKVFDLDTNINKWLYNLKDTSEMFSNDKTDIVENENFKFEFDKTGKGFLDSQKADLEKYEDGDYKSFLKQMEEKKLKKETRILSSCRYCLENGKLKDYEVLTVNKHFYLMQPGRTSFPGKHLILVPVDHVYSSINIKSGDEAYTTYQKMKKQIVEFFKMEYQCSTLIYETAMNFNRVPHCKVEFFAFDSEFENQMPMFFEIGYRDLGSDWSTHQKAIKVLRSKGGLVKQIPDKFEYAYVEWGLNEDTKLQNEQEDWIGLVHIIEDPENFDRKFFYEVMGSAMELDILVAKAPQELEEKQMVQFKNVFRNRYNLIKNKLEIEE